MKRFLLLLLAVFAGTVSAEGLKIGLVLPFSSPEGAALQQLLSGLQRTIRLQPSPALRDLTFIERDDRGSPERSAALARELIADEGVHALICCLGSRSAEAVAPVAVEHGVLTLSLAGSSSLAPDTVLLSLEPDVLTGMRALTLAAAAHQGDVSLLTTNDSAGKEAEEAFRAGALEAGTPVMRVVQFRPGSRPLTPEALLAAASGAEAIIVWAEETDTQEALRALAARGWDGPVLIRHEWAAAAGRPPGAMTPETVVPPALFTGSPSIPAANQAAVAAWRATGAAGLTGTERSLPGALLNDAVRLVLAAFEQAYVYSSSLDLSTQQLRSALYDGLAGAGTQPLAAGTYRLSGRSWSLALPEGLIPASAGSGRFLPPVR